MGAPKNRVHPNVTETISTTQAIAPDVRDWLLAELRFPVMATIKQSGMPSQSVVWFDLDPERHDIVIMNTRADRLKHGHLRRDPRLSLCFEAGDDYVTIEGHVTLDEDPVRGLRVIQDLARRYGDDPNEFEGQHRVTIELHVERVIRHA